MILTRVPLCLHAAGVETHEALAKCAPGKRCLDALKACRVSPTKVTVHMMVDRKDEDLTTRSVCARCSRYLHINNMSSALECWRCTFALLLHPTARGRGALVIEEKREGEVLPQPVLLQHTL